MMRNCLYLVFIPSKYSLSLPCDPIEPTRFLAIIGRRFPNRDIEPCDDLAILALFPTQDVAKSLRCKPISFGSQP